MIDRKTAIRHLDPTHRPDDRLEALQQTRNLKMTRSAHAYVRGSTVKFYAWLEASKGKLPEGPSVWICGDCHVGNLGPLGDAKGRVSVQIRDLDQTVVGNPAHDLVRLGLSLASAARGSELSGIVTAKIIEAVMVGYENGIGGDFSRTIDRNRRPDDVQSLLERSVKRRWRHLAVERLKDAEPTIPLGKSFWTLRKAEAAALRTLLASEAVHAMVAGLQGRDAGAAVEMVDAAYWKKGCSSLGRPRYAVIVRVGEGEGSTFCLVDVKAATTAAAPRAASAAMPRDNAMRVLAGAQALSPNLGDRMVAARLQEHGVVLRELMPQDLKIEVERLSEDQAVELARYLAGIVGRSHGRQMSPDVRKAWRAELIRDHTTALAAPSWLWSSVVELLGIHESAYLDHCRRMMVEAR